MESDNDSWKSKLKFCFQIWSGVGQAQTDASGRLFLPCLKGKFSENVFYLVIFKWLIIIIFDHQECYQMYLPLCHNDQFPRPHMKGWHTVVPSAGSFLTQFPTESDTSNVIRFLTLIISSIGVQTTLQDNDTFECEDCHKMFKNEKNLRHHYKTHHELPHPKKTTGATSGKPEPSDKVLS